VSEFRKVAILGGGLLGGSLALALAARGGPGASLWARRRQTVQDARAAGISGASEDLGEALEGAELVILGVPVGAMPGLVERALASGLGPGTLVSDVGSVKRVVHEALGPMLREAGVPFIGGHPMAGSERQGIASSRADLFEGAACLLSDDEGVGQPLAARLEAFWAGIGCRVTWTDARRHDELVARISHFPHLMAAATALVSLGDPAEARFGGGGLRDTTRVAGGDSGMWSEILTENREAVAAALRESIEGLGEMLAMLEAGDHEAVRSWLERARSLHQASRDAR